MYVYAEDSGTYTCVAENLIGKAETTTQFNCEGNSFFLRLQILSVNNLFLAKSKIYLDTQHPQSVQRIHEIEAPKVAPEELPEVEKQVGFFFILIKI